MFKVIKTALAALFLACMIGCAGTPAANNSKQIGGAAPAWVSNPKSVYPESKYLSSVGYGPDRESAEKDALGDLTAVFGQSVQGATTAGYNYQQAVSNGLLSAEENRELDTVVKTSFAMDTLIGVEIDTVWFNGHDTYYAVAVMDRQKCSVLYRDLIESNFDIISTLTESLTSEQRNSFVGLSNYKMAAVIADANAAFINVLSVLDPPQAAPLRQKARPGEEYRIQAGRITRTIPVSVTIDNDYSGRIKGAFSEVYADAGFQTGGIDAPYQLQVSVSLEEAVLGENPNKFFRYAISANLVEKSTDQVLIPYNISGREGSVSISEAQNRTLRTIEQKIRADYAGTLEEYLAGL